MYIEHVNAASMASTCQTRHQHHRTLVLLAANSSKKRFHQEESFSVQTTVHRWLLHHHQLRLQLHQAQQLHLQSPNTDKHIPVAEAVPVTTPIPATQKAEPVQGDQEGQLDPDMRMDSHTDYIEPSFDIRLLR